MRLRTDVLDNEPGGRPRQRSSDHIRQILDDLGLAGKVRLE